jgi:hypothetical protein
MDPVPVNSRHVVKPFGMFGSLYRLTDRGLFLFRVRQGFCLVTIASLILTLGIFVPLPYFYPTLLWGLTGYFIADHVLLAQILREGTRIEDSY